MMCETYSVSDFYSEIIKMSDVQDAIADKYGKEHCQKIVKGFSEGIYYHITPGDIEDLIFDLIDSDYEVDDTIYGVGGYGEYPIEIRSFGPLFWVEAQEFDPIQYFKSFDDALSCAESTYETNDE